MADSKISQLTGATTPLAGTEVLPIVQSSTTKKVAVSDLTLGRTVRMLKLGVGTTTPTYDVDVILSQAQVFSRILNQATSTNSLATQIVAANNGTVSYQLDVDGIGSVFAAGAKAGTTTNHPYTLKTNNTDRVTIAANGNVTINTGEFATNNKIVQNGTANTLTTDCSTHVSSMVLNATLTISAMTGGFIEIAEATYGGCALILVGSGATTIISQSSINRFSTVAGTANLINVYTSGSNVIIENKNAATFDVRTCIRRLS